MGSCLYDSYDVDCALPCGTWIFNSTIPIAPCSSRCHSKGNIFHQLPPTRCYDHVVPVFIWHLLYHPGETLVNFLSDPLGGNSLYASPASFPGLVPSSAPGHCSCRHAGWYCGRWVGTLDPPKSPWTEFLQCKDDIISSRPGSFWAGALWPDTGYIPQIWKGRELAK